MNKLMMFPLTILFILTMWTIIFTGDSYSLSSNYTDTQIVVNGTLVNVTDEIPKVGKASYNIWDIAGAIAILIASITVAILCGIETFIVSISEHAQHLIFNGSLFGGLWASVSFAINDYLLDEPFMFLIWIGLTVMYVIGMGIHMGASGE